MAFPTSITVRFRGLAIEDFLTSDELTPVLQPVLGLGDTLITPFVAATSDVAATAAGLRAGDIYLDTSVTPFRFRINNSSSAVAGGGTGVVKLTGTGNIVVGQLNDAAAAYVGQIFVPNSIVGDIVCVSTVPFLPVGIRLFGTVQTAGVVTVEAWNLTGDFVTPGALAVNVLILR